MKASKQKDFGEALDEIRVVTNDDEELVIGEHHQKVSMIESVVKESTINEISRISYAVRGRSSTNMTLSNIGDVSPLPPKKDQILFDPIIKNKFTSRNDNGHTRSESTDGGMFREFYKKRA
jgi:hypothetical protein